MYIYIYIYSDTNGRAPLLPFPRRSSFMSGKMRCALDYGELALFVRALCVGGLVGSTRAGVEQLRLMAGRGGG